MTSYKQTTQEVRDAFDALCKGRVKDAVEAEREACASECDEWIKNGNSLAEDIAAAIRARGSNT
jgi:hypothetical protein